MDVSLIFPAFFAGLLTFIAPCTLPLIPAYLGIISGSAITHIHDSHGGKKARATVFLNGFFFVIGFTVVFMIFGGIFGFIGSSLHAYRSTLAQIGGVFIVIFGLFMLGAFNLPFLQNTKRFKLPTIFHAGNPLNASIVGVTFGLGWTPCIGPVLGSILFIASTRSSVLEGIFLLIIFSLGLAIPFLLVALGIGHLTQYMQRLHRLIKWSSWIGGLFLIFLGILLITDSLNIWVSWFFSLFHFINYESILNYL